MVAGSAAGVVPPTTSKALGTLLRVLGGREGIVGVSGWGPLKGARPNCLEF